jgi:hypothetical protein
MNDKTHRIKSAITGFALAAAVAAFVASSALASGGNSPYLTYPQASKTQTGYAAAIERHFTHEDSLYGETATTPQTGNAAAMERHFKHEDSLYGETGSKLAQCPCNVGLPAGAGGASTVVTSSQAGLSHCPCNVGLTGGPRLSTPVAGSATPVLKPRGGFNWGIGAGAALGLALIALTIGSLAAGARTDPKPNCHRNIKQRRRLARALERSAAPERPYMGRGPRYLVQPNVAMACAPSLRSIATALRDEACMLDEDGLHAVLSFITEGGSPFFGRDTTEALREAVRLQHNVIGTETAALDKERIAAAA